MLQAELERVQEGKPMEDLDITRYRLDKPPLARRNDFAAWKKALENAHSQLGHQYNRCAWLAHQNVDVKAPWRQQLLSWQSCAALRRHAHNVIIVRLFSYACRVVNLELLLKFGPKAYRVQNASLDAANSRSAAQDSAVSRSD